MKRILKLALPILVFAVAVGLPLFFFAPFGHAQKRKVDGHLVPLPQEFIVNLAGGHYGKISVALLLRDPPPPPATAGPPVPKEYAAVRAVITDELTGLEPSELIDRVPRHRLVQRLELALGRRTDEHVKRVLLTDIAVQ